MYEYILMHGQFYEIHDDEFYHAGVKGMKWGVRNDKTNTGSTSRRPKTTNTTVTKTIKRENTRTIKTKNGNQKAKLTIKRNRGAKISG